ncbi:SIDL trafficking protein particle complex subunit 10 isoform X2 [Brevipalpus obovatus]|uniref:SIDL trafficking protein particle complex subunit 10 isoform X2 n=1 Tax=Brevipalpus obovatus TaxID=246614 RepID=UPI003D9F6595
MMNTKPLISYCSGNTSLVERLKDKIMMNLPEECVEWERSYGRSTKKVYLEANFVPFKESYLKKNIPSVTNNSNSLSNSNNFNNSASIESRNSLLGQCLLHTYWFECSDIDSYKSKIREDVISWINKLREYEIWDWLVVIVDSNDRKKSNKAKLLTRTTVADKVRSDFPSSVKDAGDRCISLFNPLKNESSAQDSYEFFLHRLRYLLLKSYSKHLTHYEDYIRTQRENRNSKDWNFFKFFILQEELAFAFEMLSLYEDALVQYDELDALFSQFVINSHVLQPPEWLRSLIERCHFWNGLSLCKDIQAELREKIRDSSASLLDLRNYLFSRQSDLLFVQHKPWELSLRALPFLQNCVNELNILEIDFPPGAVACWVFLSALEILMKCERYNDSSQMQFYSRHTVGLWAYARKKVKKLGVLCGLMPGMRHDSECIHKVVGLISGMGKDPYLDGQTSPQIRLKDALSNPESFLKAYLEVSELTISTFKHIGHFRSARLIGRELAFLYMKMNRSQQSIPFFLDLEKVFLQERWVTLVADTRKNLLQCYTTLEDTKKVHHYSLLLAANPHIAVEERKQYLDEALKQNFLNKCHLPMEELLSVCSFSVRTQGVFVTNSKIELVVVIKSLFLKPISISFIKLHLIYEPLTPKVKTKSPDKQYRETNICPHNAKDFKTSTVRPRFETYHTSIEVGVKCPNLNRCFRRTEELHEPSIDSIAKKLENTPFFQAENLTLEPGLNEKVLIFEPMEYGCFTAEEIELQFHDNVYLIHKPLPSHLCFSVISEDPSLKVLPLETMSGGDSSSNSSEILAGMPQRIILRLNSGSYTFSPNSPLTLKSSSDLCMLLDNPNCDKSNHVQPQEFTRTLDITLDQVIEPFQEYDIYLKVKCKFASQRAPSGLEHNIILHYAENNTDKPKAVKKVLYFIPPFMSTLKLFTNNTKKFIEITVRSACNQRIELFDANLIFQSGKESELQIKSMNPPTRMVIFRDQLVHYLWSVSPSEHQNPKFLFTLKYNLTGEVSEDPLGYHYYECDFKLNNYQTLYLIRASVEPTKGSEYCRVGAVCQLRVTIEKVRSSSDSSSVMYEVIADSNLWNINGRTAGVIDTNIDTKYSLVFDVLPLVSGRLPVPSIRLSKYVYAYQQIDHQPMSDTEPESSSNSLPSSGNEENRRKEAKLVAFESGQIYNTSRGLQVNVLPSSGLLVN